MKYGTSIFKQCHFLPSKRLFSILKLCYQGLHSLCIINLFDEYFEIHILSFFLWGRQEQNYQFRLTLMGLAIKKIGVNFDITKC